MSLSDQSTKVMNGSINSFEMRVKILKDLDVAIHCLDTLENTSQEINDICKKLDDMIMTSHKYLYDTKYLAQTPPVPETIKIAFSSLLEDSSTDSDTK